MKACHVRIVRREQGDFGFRLIANDKTQIGAAFGFPDADSAARRAVEVSRKLFGHVKRKLQ